MVRRRSRECGLLKVSTTPKFDWGARHTAKTSWLNPTVTPNQESAKDWLSHDVQDTIEHSLGVG